MRPPGFRWCSLAFVLAGLLLTLTVQSAEENAPTLEPREGWSDLFSDKDVEFHFAVKAARAW
jgi:hypothetical protein